MSDMELELAAAAARARRARGGNRPLALVNRGIAGFGDAVVGGVGGLLNEGTEALGAGRPFNETPASDLFDAAGIRTAEPQGIGEQALTGIGEAAASLVPVAGTLRALAAGAGPMANAARTLLSGMTTKTGAVSELAAGAGASSAQEAAQGTAFEPVAPVLGGMAGGAAVYGVPTAGRAAVNAVGNTPLARTVRSAVAPFGKNGARIIAEDMVRGATPDRFQAANNLAEPNIGNLSVAQQTGDQGIMGIERAVAAADPQFRGRLDAQTAASREALNAEISAPAQGRSPRDMTLFFRERMDRHRETIGRYLQRAERELDQRMRRVQPGRDREAASVWASREIDKAFDAASGREAELWSKVPRNVMIGTQNAKRAYQEMLDEATRVAPETIPGKAHKFLGDSEEAFGDEVSLAELYKLYSRVRRAGREAMALTVPDEETARRSGKIADAILADIQEAEATSTAPRLLADARAMSTEIAEQFGQGNVARIMARTRSGGDRIPEAEALRRTVGQSREAGGVAVDDLRRATGGATDNPVADYLRDEFVTSATRPDGRVDANAVERFARSNREALARFDSTVEKEVFDVRSAAREVIRRRDRVENIVASLADTKRGTVPGVVNAPMGREVARGVFEAENPTMAARTIARAAQRDQTGNAYLGYKSGIYDEIISRSGSDGAVTGDRLLRTLNDRTVRLVLDASMPPSETARLRRLAEQMRKVETSLNARQVDTENLPNNLISTFVQVQAAKAGRAMGTGTIQVPGMFTARAREILGRAFNDRADALIRAALENPKIMSDLLIGPSASRGRIREAESRLMSWAAGTAAATISEE